MTGKLRMWATTLLLLLLTDAARAAVAGNPSRLSVDFSSSLITSPDNAPAAVMSRLQSLLKDMEADGVNSLCNGRLPEHISKTSSTDCKFKLPAAAQDSNPCSCSGLNKNRCSCTGQLTGAQYFSEDNAGLELARVLVVASGTSHNISGGINANFNSTVRLVKGARLYVNAARTNTPGAADLELDNSHLDLLESSHILLQHDSDLEIEDSSTIWIAGGSSLSAHNNSKMEFRLSHTLVEGGSSVSLSMSSTWNVSQEWDVTPAQASAVCNTPFTLDPDAEYCFNNKEACKQRWALLTSAQKQAVFMVQYPPVLDEWGRQAFDYSDDVLYDDMYDEDYQEPELDSGKCLGPDVCGDSTKQGSSSSTQPPIPQEPHNLRKLLRADDTNAAAAAASTTSNMFKEVTEVNAKDSADGKGYDAQFGEGPFGETLCDAPPHRSFNYYGLVVRDGSTVKITGNSSWLLYDKSRAFVQDSTIILDDTASLHLFNTTLVLINSQLILKGKSEVKLQFFSSLQLYNSKVINDNAMYALTPNSTWRGQPWSQPGDYRASPGGALPAYMGARAGVQLGTYPMRIMGFGLEARMLPAAGCQCKKPARVVSSAKVLSLANVPSPGDGGSAMSALAGLV